MPTSTTFPTDSEKPAVAIFPHSFGRLTVRDRVVLTVLGWSAGLRAVLGAPPVACGCRGSWHRGHDDRLLFLATDPESCCPEHSRARHA